MGTVPIRPCLLAGKPPGARNRGTGIRASGHAWEGLGGEPGGVTAGDRLQGSESGSIRVVIVDDNESFVHAARAVLQRGGATVVGTALSGAAATQVVLASRPDVVLVDVDLGHESGFAVAQQVAAVADVRIVMISAHPAEDFAEMVSGSVAIGFVPKAELSMNAIRNLLGDDVERG